MGTWLPERPTEPHYSYFGNPAMKFKRLSSQAASKTNQGPEPASCLARFWHHFSTSVLDVFLYRGVQGTVAELHSLLVSFSGKGLPSSHFRCVGSLSPGRNGDRRCLRGEPDQRA